MPTVIGLDKDEYLKLELKNSNLSEVDFEENMMEITIRDDSVFVLGYDK